MNRLNLVWFAAGAAASSAVSVAVTLLAPEPVTLSPFLILEEPVNSNRDGRVSDLETIANEGGELLRNCGATSFEMTSLYNDHLPTAEFPISADSASALGCVLEQANARDYRLNIEFRRD